MENLKSRQLCLKYAEGQRMANDDAKDMKQKQESYVRGWLQRMDVFVFPTVNTDSATSHMFNNSSTLKLSNYDLRLFPSVSALILCSRSTVVYSTRVIYLFIFRSLGFVPASFTIPSRWTHLQQHPQRTHVCVWWWRGNAEAAGTPYTDSWCYVSTVKSLFPQCVIKGLISC